MNHIPTNPTEGRGTPVWAPLYHSANGKRIMSAGWLLDIDAATKRARVWVGSKLLTFHVGEVENRTLPA